MTETATTLATELCDAAVAIAACEGGSLIESDPDGSAHFVLRFGGRGDEPEVQYRVTVERVDGVREDWTRGPDGRSNSSPAFVAAVAHVERVIRDSAHTLMNNGAGITAGVIVANLAHMDEFRFRPSGLGAVTKRGEAGLAEATSEFVMAADVRDERAVQVRLARAPGVSNDVREGAKSRHAASEQRYYQARADVVAALQAPIDNIDSETAQPGRASERQDLLDEVANEIEHSFSGALEIAKRMREWDNPIRGILPPLPTPVDVWGSRETDTNDPNLGRTCMLCNAPIRAGDRYTHECQAMRDARAPSGTERERALVSEAVAGFLRGDGDKHADPTAAIIAAVDLTHPRAREHESGCSWTGRGTACICVMGLRREAATMRSACCSMAIRCAGCGRDLSQEPADSRTHPRAPINDAVLMAVAEAAFLEGYEPPAGDLRSEVLPAIIHRCLAARKAER